MALTPEEAAELRRLEAEEAEHQESLKGTAALAKIDDHRLKPRRPEARPLSAYRVTVGGIRDVAQGALDLVDEAGDALQRLAPLPVVRIGNSSDNGVIDVLTGRAATDFTDRTRNTPALPRLKGEEDAGTAERVLRGLTSYMVPFLGWSKVFGVAKASSWLGRGGRAMAAGAAVDFTSLDPQAANLANTVRDAFGIDSAALDALASEEDDNRLWSRFKAAAVNAPIGLAADAALEGGFRGLKAYRAWRGSLEEADAAVHAARAELPLERAVADAHGAPGVKGHRGPIPNAPGTFDEAIQVRPDKEPSSFEDVLDFLKRKARIGDLDEAMFARLAQNLVEGNPENALAKLGIDPLKLDYSKFDDPDLLGRLQKGLADVYETIGQRLGRSDIRVTERETAMAARALATTADTLKDIYGHTENLAEVLMASRLFVGAHAHKLVAQAETALAALRNGGGDEQWLEFLESFQRHAYYLGALRGAGSEVGRALRSLQMVAKVGKKTVRRNLDEALGSEAQSQSADAASVAEAATEAVGRMATPAEQMLFLAKIIEKSGDVGDLSRFVRTKAGSTLTRLDTALGETRGNLFSSSTAVLNALSGTSMLGLTAVSKALGGIGRMALSPIGKQHSVAARVQLMEAWAFADGVLGAWRDAFGNTFALLEREGMEEVAINLDSVGAKGLAAKAAGLATEGSSRVRGNFERVDISARERAFALTAADSRHLKEVIEAWNTPRLMEHSMKWLLKTAAPAINAAGTLSRLGTILFVNASDQLVGTVAARAGAQAHAVRLAAQEAAELQLEGKALSDYLKARMVQLTETVDGFADDSYSAGQREVALAHGDAEARATLFQDELEIGFSRSLANGLSRVPMFHLFVPFVRTPLRILERTALDYTPLGLLKDRIRRDIVAGGPARDEALARLGLGTLLVYTAFQLAEDRTIVGSDGSYRSSARLSRPAFTLKVGDDLVEFSRVDPLGTLLGWGADVRAYLADQEDNAEASGIAGQLIEAAVIATSANVLSKTWLTSLRSLVDLSSDVRGGASAEGWAKYLQGFAARFVPASGIQRSIRKSLDGNVREASSFMEGLLKASFGADRLPVKRDYLIGRPLPVESGERLFGAKAGPGASDEDDPLLAELERLSFDLPAAHRSIKGVKLTSAQFSRWLELKGQVVRSEATGLTLEETLRQLIELPEYQSLHRPRRVQAMRDEMRGFAMLATRQLIREDDEFARRVLAKEVWSAETLKGSSPEQRDVETERFARELGLIE